MLIAFVIYPGLTALDLVGPLEVLARVPGVECRLAAAQPGLVEAQYGLRFDVGLSWNDCPQCDLVVVPGGPGQVEAAENESLLAFLRRQAVDARWMTAVCTGSLVLGAAGLLRGYRATTHWRYLDCLRDFGAAPVRKRVVADRERITAAGVSAGIDMGLFLAALIAGDAAAQSIQLQMEYDPQPAFRAGSPEQADAALVEGVEEATADLYARRREQSRRLGRQSVPSPGS